MIDVKQCTILWHVDDIKIYRLDPAVVESILALLNKRYGKEAPLVVTRGKVHDYLGMTLNFSVEGKIKINMQDYIKDMLEDLPKDMNGESATCPLLIICSL